MSIGRIQFSEKYMIKVYVFHTGRVRVDQAIPFGDKNPLAVTGLFRGQDKKLRLPVSAYLIESPEGRILVDTGWDPESGKKRGRFLGIMKAISTPIVREDEGVDSKLAQLGLRPADIDEVFLSHLDLDHVDGIRLVRDAKRFRASAEEIKDAKENPFRYDKKEWSDVTIEPFEFQNTGIGPVGRSYDVFGNGSVVLVSTPGHSSGLFAVKITEGGKYVILAGDSVYARRSWEEGLLPGLMADREAAEKSLEWIRLCAQDPNCLGVFANHDPEIKEQVIEMGKNELSVEDRLA